MYPANWQVPGFDRLSTELFQMSRSLVDNLACI